MGCLYSGKLDVLMGYRLGYPYRGITVLVMDRVWPRQCGEMGTSVYSSIFIIHATSMLMLKSTINLSIYLNIFTCTPR